MPDFDDWLKGQQTKTPAQRPKPAVSSGGGFDSWLTGQSKPQPKRDAAAEAEAALIGYDPKGYDDQGRPISQKPSFVENVKIGAERGYRRYLQPAISSIAEVTEGVKRGDFGPLLEMGESALRGTVEALRPPQDPEAYRDPAMGGRLNLKPQSPRDTRITELQQQREARYQATPDYQRSQSRLAELDQRAAMDPSYFGKATRGTSEVVTGAAPTLAAAVASRGSLPIVGLTAAAQSAHQPAMMGPQAAASILPLPGAKAVASGLRRLRGRTTAPARLRPTQPLPPGAAAIPDAPPTQEPPSFSRWIERENAPTGELPALSVIEETPTAGLPALSVSQSRAGATGPSLAEDALTASRQVPETPSLGRAIGNTLRTASQGMRTMWTAFDFSAPFNQGAILSIAHPIKGARSFGKMFRSLSKTQSDKIDAEILANPHLQLGEDFGLYVATSAKAKGLPEEFFALEALNKLPGIRHSERTFRTYLDTLRLSTWESYVKALQRAGHTPDANPKAYKQLAEFINIATGRGALKAGGKLEKAVDLGGDILFAPRNLIAKFQVLDPVRYANLAPGARKLVLRDATTAFGAMISTAALLKAAGVNVGFNPEEDNFMQARIGDTRYDLSFGNRVQVQFLGRMMASTYREATGEGNLPYKDPLSTAERFGRGKLSPAFSTAVTFGTGRDYKGEEVKDKSAGKIAWEAAAPLLARDLVEAYKEEGARGLAKHFPSAFGLRVSTYPDRAKSQWIETSPAVRAEQKKLGIERPYLTPKKGESAADFNARHDRFERVWSKFSDELIREPSFKSADAEVKEAALDALRRYLQAGERGEVGYKTMAEIIYAAERVIEKRKEKQK